MGINGLTSFVHQRKELLLKKKKLRKCTLVIDGNSLCAQLAKDINCRAAFGGDYCHYGNNLVFFYKQLKQCDIKPIVLMDGCYEEKKIYTVLSRVASRMAEACTITPLTEKCGKSVLFPPLLRDTFIQVTIEEGISFFCCPLEADPQLAALAKKLNCPLLSLDSDFFISDVEYIPYSELERKIVKDSGGFYMPCRACQPGAFAASFKILPECLPLMATLLGNDYVKRSSFKPFLRNLKMTDGGKNDLGKRRVVGLIRWMHNETAETALEKVLNRFKKKYRDKVEIKIQKSLEAYSVVDCIALNKLGIIDFPAEEDDLLNVQTDDDSEDNREDRVSSDDETGEEDEEQDPPVSETDSDAEESEEEFQIHSYQIPEWVENSMACGSLSPRLLDLLRGSFYLGNPQAEDFNMPDSFICTFPIVRFIHALIAKEPNANISYEGRRGFSRASLAIPSHYVEKIQQFEGPPPLRLLYDFYKNFGIESTTLDSLLKFPPDSQLFLLALIWMKKSKDCELTSDKAYTLLLCYLTNAVVARKVGECRLHKLEKKYFKRIHELKCNKINRENSVVELSYPNDDDVTLDDAILSGLALFKYLEVNGVLFTSQKLFKRQYLHTFGQFQHCLQQTSHLNVLFGNFLKPCNYRYTYSGPFVYNMYVNLKKREYPGSYIFHLLETAPTLLKYFIAVARFVGLEDCVSPNSISKPIRKRRKHKRKGKKEDEDDINNKNVSEAEEDSSTIVDINNKFHILSIS